MRKVTRIGVYGVAIKDNKILLVEKGTGGSYSGLWDLPGGGVEFGETAEETLRREFREEVGMSFEQMEHLSNYSHCAKVFHVPDPFHFHHLGQVYRVFNFQTIPSIKPEDNFIWEDISKLNREMLTPFAKSALESLQ